MGPLAKIALGGGLSGLMLAIAVGSALRSPASAPVLPDTRATVAVPVDATPSRCRTITQSESACASAWEVRRRHFFGEEATR